MRVVTFDFEVFKAVVENRIGFAFNHQLRQRARFARQLQGGLLHVVAVQVGIPAGPDEVAHFQVALLRHHMHQQRIAGDVERQAEEHVAWALVQLAGELAVCHVELEKCVARCQRHFVQLTHVPRRNDDTARVRVIFQLVHDGGDLVNMTAIRGRPGAPLFAVDRAKVAVLIGPLIPDADVIFMQVGNIGVALQEPQQFMDDRAQVAALGGHQRETFLQVKAHLVAKNGERTGAGTVIFLGALIEHLLHQFEILFHASSGDLFLRTAKRPDHHNDTRKHHRNRKNLPHADVLYPLAGELRIRLAEEFRDDAEQTVANQEQAGNWPCRTRLTDKPVQDQEQDNPFQRQFIQLRRVARQGTVSIKQRLPFRMRRQQRQVFRTGAREQHSVVETRIDAAPQLAVDKVTQTTAAQAERNQRRNEVRYLEEGTLSAFGEDNHHHDHADQATVEGHSAVPDAEQIQRILQEGVEVVEHHVADAPAEEYPEEARIQQVFNFVFGPAAVWAVRTTRRQPHGKDKTHQVHHAVPMQGDRSDGENYRIKVRETQITTIHLSPQMLVIPPKVDSGRDARRRLQALQRCEW